MRDSVSVAAAAPAAAPAAAAGTAVPSSSSAALPAVQPCSISSLVFASRKRAADMFAESFAGFAGYSAEVRKLKVDSKRVDEYDAVLKAQATAAAAAASAGRPVAKPTPAPVAVAATAGAGAGAGAAAGASGAATPSTALTTLASSSGGASADASRALMLPLVPGTDTQAVKPTWHAPWKLMRVISGHMGWVRAVAVDPTNDWFATGSADRTIKIWDLASGVLKLTLTGHINCVRGLTVSARHPYLFSCGDDKMVRCWDLEQNKVVRHYHGHLSGVYSIALHPTLDILVTGGRDSVARVWDVRTKNHIFALSGHTHSVWSVVCQSAEPQVVSASSDTTIKLWDLAAGKCRTTLTHHKKGIRSLALHPTKYCMASGGSDHIKQWRFPEGQFMQNMIGDTGVVNALAINRDEVVASGSDNGTLFFWDWKSGYNFQTETTKVQPGSLDAEAGIYSMAFDVTGTRLITGEADKTIKVWREDSSASEESFPIDYRKYARQIQEQKRHL